MNAHAIENINFWEQYAQVTFDVIGWSLRCVASLVHIDMVRVHFTVHVWLIGACFTSKQSQGCFVPRGTSP
jgi:hypothetical protein